MLTHYLSRTRPALRHQDVLAREMLLLTGIAAIAALVLASGNRSFSLMLDALLITGGLIGLLTMVFSRYPGRWWYMGLAGTAMIAGAVQLYLTSGPALGFLVLVALLPLGDALANILILALRLRTAVRHRP